MFGVTEAVLLSGLKMQRQAYELRWRLERERALPVPPFTNGRQA